MSWLWKEWRDHRAVVVAMAVAVPVLLALGSAFLPESVVADAIYPTVAALGCFALVVLGIGADLVPGEDRRGHMALLRRLPGGLLAPFVAKLLFLALCLAFFSAWGYAAACLVAGAWPAPDPRLLRWAPAILCATPWVLVVSCWLPRGSLALPGAALVLGACLLPLWLILSPDRIVTTDAEQSGLAVLLGGGALPVAALSFARGYRFGGGIGSAAWRGLLASLVLFSLSWAYAGHRVREWWTVDPRADDFRIGWAAVGEGGRYLFVDVGDRGHRSPMHALVADLETGEWEVRGRPGDVFMPTRLPVPQRFVAVEDVRSIVRVEEGSRWTKSWVQYLDGRTALPVKSGWSNLPLPEVAPPVAGLPDGWTLFGPAGLGYLVWREGEIAVYDPFRRKLFPLDRDRWTLVRDGRWLMGRGKLSLVDPETGDSEELGVSARSHPAIVPDGRVLYADAATKELVLFDPETRDRRVVHGGPVVEWWPVGSTSVGWLREEGRKERLARLDPVEAKLIFAPGWDAGRFQVVAVLDQDRLVGIEPGQRRIFQLSVSTGRRETLFPR